jgi:hypothetical protein
MSQLAKFEFTTPCSRLVAGDAMKKHPSMDDNGAQRLIKTGQNAGQPREDFYVGIAVPKTQADWKNEPWGRVIVQAAVAAFPHLVDANGNNTNPNMPVAMKVIDGDSPHPNKAGSIPNQKEGYPGHWIINAASAGSPARLYEFDHQAKVAKPLTAGKEIKRGYFVQLNAEVTSNNSTQQPGVYVNPNMICLIAFGDEIYSGPDVDSAGFGVDATQLPQGASMTPTGGVTSTGQVDTPPATNQAPPQDDTPPPPATDLANGPGTDDTPPPPVEELFSYQGKPGKTRAQWNAAGWKDAQIDQHCTKL